MIKENKVEEAFKIIDKDAKILNVTSTKDGKAILHNILEYLNDSNQAEKLLEELKKRKANIDIKINSYKVEDFEINGATPLHLAAAYNLPKVFDLLMKNGANIYEVTYFGTNILHYAIMFDSHDFIKKLFEFEDGKTFVNMSNISNQTPLHIAVSKYNYDLVEFLINNGAGINVTDLYLETPLHYACRLVADSSNQKLRIISLLLNKGANINAQDNRGDTPLHVAAFNHPDIIAVKLLLTYMPSLKIKNNHDESPLSLALHNYNDDISQLIINKDKENKNKDVK